MPVVVDRDQAQTARGQRPLENPERDLTGPLRLPDRGRADAEDSRQLALAQVGPAAGPPEEADDIEKAVHGTEPPARAGRPTGAAGDLWTNESLWTTPAHADPDASRRGRWSRAGYASAQHTRARHSRPEPGTTARKCLLGVIQHRQSRREGRCGPGRQVWSRNRAPAPPA
jgi:hypothetical protein